MDQRLLILASLSIEVLCGTRRLQMRVPISKLHRSRLALLASQLSQGNSPIKHRFRFNKFRHKKDGGLAIIWISMNSYYWISKAGGTYL